MSSRKYDNVIVFGPTGTVAGITALEAHQRGAKVWLAMRDPSKPISEIPADVEKAGSFTRVQADLTDPSSVGKAAQVSGAKAAYIYLVFAASPDVMRASLQALRDAGVEYVVFLSSFSIRGAAREVQPQDFIPYKHAQVEIVLEEVGFPHVTMLRPGQFASNYLRNFLDRAARPPKAYYTFEDATQDNLAPEDIGAVSGAVLVERPVEGGKKVIYLCGPELLSMAASWDVVKQITGRGDIETRSSSPEGYVRGLIEKGIPAHVAEDLASAQGLSRDCAALYPLGDTAALYPNTSYLAAVENIEKYSGRPATKFADYLEAHKAEWLAL